MQTDSAPPPLTSIIIPAWNGAAFIAPCLRSLRECTALPFEVIVVDNGSQDDTVALVRTFADARLITNPHNTGFAHAVNQGLHAATGEVFILMNQDIVAHPGWLEPIHSRLQQQPDAGVIGCKLLYPDGQVQHAGGYLLEPSCEGVHFADDNPANVLDFVTGAAFAIRRACWQAVGDFDEAFYPAYFEDVDYCLRARALGWQVIYEPQSVLTHHESQSRGSDFALVVNYHAQRLRLVLKHNPIDWILNTFLTNERQRAHHNDAHIWLHAMAHVYLQGVRNAYALPHVAQSPDIDELVNALFELRHLVLRRATAAELLK
jgi:GT2 family glycosyltransferase